MNGEEIAKLIDRDHEVERLDRGRERDLSRWAPARCGCRSWQINPNRGWQQVMCGHQLSPPKNSGGESYSDGGGCARRCESSCNSLAYPLDGRVSDLAQFAKVFEICPAWHTLAREVRPTGPARGATPVEFIILGPTALCVKGQRIDLGAAKQRGMLGILLYHAGEPVRIDLLVEQLWDDGRSLDDYRANLYALASRIRAALNRVGMGRALVRLNSMPAYRLDVDPNLVDFHRFKRMVAEVRQAAGQQHHTPPRCLPGRPHSGQTCHSPIFGARTPNTCGAICTTRNWRPTSFWRSASSRSGSTSPCWPGWNHSCAPTGSTRPWLSTGSPPYTRPAVRAMRAHFWLTFGAASAKRCARSQRSRCRTSAHGRDSPERGPGTPRQHPASYRRTSATSPDTSGC